ncbi:MAG TPA: Hsp70 family protein [Trebonia sp.]|jgi:molecular chaperone DnaK (HSP70)
MVYGIDLGTTYSCVARIDETGKPAIVQSAMGEDTTPSVVFFESPASVLVGQPAKSEGLLAPDLTADLVKLDMGTNAEYTFHGERHTPETVSALILRELTRAAQEQTGEPVRDVVITVPASFGIAEREATRRAGEFAGLTVLDILDEPIAAAIHYQSLAHPARDAPGSEGTGARHILVYDLGGGTFDTTIIRLEGENVLVACTDGDGHLGGADWDQAITAHLLDQLTSEHPGLRPAEDKQFMRDLLLSAEELKVKLSKARSQRHIMRLRGLVTQVELTRDTVEELTADLLTRTMAVTERAIETAQRKGIPRIDEVLLAGGMSRWPAVARELKERLGLDARQHEPEFAVAKGAAMFAQLRADQHPGQQAGPQQSAPLRNGLPGTGRVGAVASRSFGVRTIDGNDPRAMTEPLRARHIVVHLLQANTPLPADTGPFPFHTPIDNARMVGVEVWEQSGPEESEDLAHNKKVGGGLLRNLPPRLPAGTPIEVTFLMSETGKLSVHATEPTSGSELRFDLQIGDLDEAGREKARHSVAKYKVSG